VMRRYYENARAPRPPTTSRTGGLHRAARSIDGNGRLIAFIYPAPSDSLHLRDRDSELWVVIRLGGAELNMDRLCALGMPWRHGLPMATSLAAAREVLIMAVLPDRGNELVTILNASASPIDLTGWGLVDATGGRQDLSATLVAGQSRRSPRTEQSSSVIEATPPSSSTPAAAPSRR
jgi:hypothetical protein